MVCSFQNICIILQRYKLIDFNFIAFKLLYFNFSGPRKTWIYRTYVQSIMIMNKEFDEISWI